MLSASSRSRKGLAQVNEGLTTYANVIVIPRGKTQGGHHLGETEERGHGYTSHLTPDLAYFGARSIWRGCEISDVTMGLDVFDDDPPDQGVDERAPFAGVEGAGEKVEIRTSSRRF